MAPEPVGSLRREAYGGGLPTQPMTTSKDKESEDLSTGFDIDFENDDTSADASASYCCVYTHICAPRYNILTGAGRGRAYASRLV